MTGKVSISHELYLRIRAYFRCMENHCRDCFRKECKACDIGRGAAIARDIDIEVRPIRQEHGYATQTAGFAAEIMMVLEKSKEPLPSNKIIIPMCSTTMKEWALRKLLETKRIVKIKGNGKRFLYQLNKDKEQ